MSCTFPLFFFLPLSLSVSISLTLLPHEMYTRHRGDILERGEILLLSHARVILDQKKP